MDEKLDIVSLNRQAWDRVAEKYEKSPHGNISPLFDYFCNNFSKSDFILDIGSGTGLLYAKLFVEKGFKVLGIDISTQMIRLAKKNVPQVEFIELSMTNLDYQDKFEGVFSSFSMLHLNPPLFKDVARRIIRSLKKGGIFSLSLNEPWEEGADVDGEAIVEIMDEKMYSRGYSKDEILEIFTPLGMKLLKFHREIQASEIFGIEHTTHYVFKLE
jgi:SAM-dependent methyltransferase